MSDMSLRRLGTEPPQILPKKPTVPVQQAPTDVTEPLAPSRHPTGRSTGPTQSLPQELSSPENASQTRTSLQSSPMVPTRVGHLPLPSTSQPQPGSSALPSPTQALDYSPKELVRMLGDDAKIFEYFNAAIKAHNASSSVKIDNRMLQSYLMVPEAYGEGAHLALQLARETAKGGRTPTFAQNFSEQRGDLIYGRDIGRVAYYSLNNLTETQHSALQMDLKDPFVTARYVTVDKYNNSSWRTKSFPYLQSHQRTPEGPSQGSLAVDANTTRYNSERSMPERIEPSRQYYRELTGHPTYSPEALSQQLAQENPEALQKVAQENRAEFLAKTHLPKQTLEGVFSGHESIDRALQPHMSHEELQQAKQKLLEENAMMSMTRKACKYGLEFAPNHGGTIHFILDGLDLDKVATKEKTRRPPLGQDGIAGPSRVPITTSELLSVCRKQKSLGGHVKFYLNGRECPPPWEMSGKSPLWEGYAHKRWDKLMKQFHQQQQVCYQQMLKNGVDNDLAGQILFAFGSKFEAHQEQFFAVRTPSENHEALNSLKKTMRQMYAAVSQAITDAPLEARRQELAASGHTPAKL